jgi:hypothetical protein
MNAHTFDSHSVTCPICNRTGRLQSSVMFGGLYTCPYCQERLVISWSGNYVRDPFTIRQLAVGRMLRRQSRPLARALRDVGLNRRSSLMGILAGAVVIGIVIATLDSWMPERNPLKSLLQQVNEVIEFGK